MEIGNATEAAVVARGMAGTALGWRVLGEGAYRRAYLSPSGVVYKRHLHEAEWCQDNEDEHEVSRAIWAAAHLPVVAERLEVCYVPRTSLYGSILAMEYLPGAECCEDDEWRTDMVPEEIAYALSDLGIEDAHGENVLWQADRQRYVCVDLGTSSSEAVQDLISGG